MMFWGWLLCGLWIVYIETVRVCMPYQHTSRSVFLMNNVKVWKLSTIKSESQLLTKTTSGSECLINHVGIWISYKQRQGLYVNNCQIWVWIFINHKIRVSILTGSLQHTVTVCMSYQQNIRNWLVCGLMCEFLCG